MATFIKTLQRLPSPPPFAEREKDIAQVSGSNLQARWQHTLSSSSQMALQIYYQQDNRKEALQNAKLNTFDMDFQHSLALGERHKFLWGLGYRLTSDDFKDTGLSSFSPHSRRYNLFSAFIQDQVSLLPERLEATVGTKLEHNDFTGWEVQPSARLLWTPHPKHRFWAAVSRAVRTPSRAESDVNLSLIGIPPNPLTPPGFPNPPGILVFQGNPNFGSEKLIAYELGYRTWPTDSLSLDIAMFYNDYDDLLGAERRDNEITLVGNHLKIPAVFVNAVGGNTFGVELATDWRVMDWWRLQLAYSYLRVDLQTKTGFSGIIPEVTDGSQPRHQVSLRSSFDIRRDLELDLWLRYVDDIPDLRIGTLSASTRIDAYLALDVRLGWRPYRDLELSLVGTNLLEDKHLEFVQETYPFPTQVQRSVYGQLKWSF